jgi:hypothetical protein
MLNQLSGLGLHLTVIVAFGISQALISQTPNRPQTPHPPFEYSARDVAITNPEDGTRLAGTLTVPRGKNRAPAVVLAPGAGAVDRDNTMMGHKPFLVQADYLANRGIATLRLDSRGIGGSTGNYVQANGNDLATLLLAIILTLPILAAKKPKDPKPPKPPYQEDIVHGCVSVTHVEKGAWGYSGSILGVVENHCNQPLPVIVTTAFFAGGNYIGMKKGDQLESNTASATVAAGSRWNFVIQPVQYKTWAVGRAQIIEVAP